MKKLIFLMLLTGLTVYLGINRHNRIRTPTPVPLPDFNLEEDNMIDALVAKCAKEGMVDTAAVRAYWVDCMEAMCGEETVRAEFPEAPRLVRECYKKNIGLLPMILAKAKYIFSDEDRIPLSTPIPLSGFNAIERQMIDSLVMECVRTGIIDTLNINEAEDGPRCVIALCGEKTAYAEFPEAPKLVRECYKHLP